MYRATTGYCQAIELWHVLQKAQAILRDSQAVSQTELLQVCKGSQVCHAFIGQKIAAIEGELLEASHVCNVNQALQEKQLLISSGGLWLTLLIGCLALRYKKVTMLLWSQTCITKMYSFLRVSHCGTYKLSVRNGISWLRAASHNLDLSHKCTLWYGAFHDGKGPQSVPSLWCLVHGGSEHGLSSAPLVVALRKQLSPGDNPWCSCIARDQGYSGLERLLGMFSWLLCRGAVDGQAALPAAIYHTQMNSISMQPSNFRLIHIPPSAISEDVLQCFSLWHSDLEMASMIIYA